MVDPGIIYCFSGSKLSFNLMIGCSMPSGIAGVTTILYLITENEGRSYWIFKFSALYDSSESGDHLAKAVFQNGTLQPAFRNSLKQFHFNSCCI